MNLLGHGFHLTDLVHGVGWLVNVRILHRYRIAYSFSIRWTAGCLGQLLLIFGQIGGGHHWGVLVMFNIGGEWDRHLQV